MSPTACPDRLRTAVRGALAAALAPAAVVRARADHAVADPRAMVIAGDARFTVLTPQLIRMEWSPGRRFENRASLVFINRRLPVPRFTARVAAARQRLADAALSRGRRPICAR